MRRLTFVITLALMLLLVISSAGCIEKQISKDQLIARVVTAKKNLKSYVIYMDVTENVKSSGFGDPLDMDLSYNSRGVVDNVKQKIKMNTTMDIPLEGNVGVITYLVDNVMYIKYIGTNMPDTWTKTELPEGYWETLNSVDLQTKLLEKWKFEISGWEKVNGVSCFAVNMTPNANDMWNLFLEQGLINPKLSELANSIGEMIRNMSGKQWYDDRTYLPVKQDLEMTMVINSKNLKPSVSGTDDFEMTMNVSVETNMTYDNINKRVSITLPAEAENAMNLTDMIDTGTNNVNAE